MQHLNGVIRYMPIDKDARDMMSPFFSHQEQRIMTSGGDTTSRSVSGTKKKYVAAQQGWKCNDCQSQLDAWFEVDHKTRLADGGSNHIDNLVALCRNCHGKKTTFENL
jgi:5-methylcytosine-specific restriction endonuclease McrA